MTRTTGIGGNDGLPERPVARTSPPPAPVGPTSPGVSPALPARRTGSEARRRVAERSPEEMDVLSTALSQRAANVETIVGVQILLGAIESLPPVLQSEPIWQLCKRLPMIEPEKDRYPALHEIVNATVAILDKTDCSRILESLPRAIESLSLRRLTGYLHIRSMLESARRSGLVNDECYGASLAGLAHVLPLVPVVEQGPGIDASQLHLAPGAEEPHATEVHRIFSALDTVAAKHRHQAMEVLAERRFLMSPVAAIAIRHYLLGAIENEEFTSEQRIGIALALINGLRSMSALDTRFDAEFDAIYEASLEQDTQTRIRMLIELAPLRDRLSPATREEMRANFDADLAELDTPDAW